LTKKSYLVGTLYYDLMLFLLIIR